MQRFDNSPKRPTGLGLNDQVPDKASDGMNISQAVETLSWNAENKEAIEAYNQRIEREGLPLARYRTFMKDR